MHDLHERITANKGLVIDPSAAHLSLCDDVYVYRHFADTDTRTLARARRDLRAFSHLFREQPVLTPPLALKEFERVQEIVNSSLRYFHNTEPHVLMKNHRRTDDFHARYKQGKQAFDELSRTLHEFMHSVRRTVVPKETYAKEVAFVNGVVRKYKTEKQLYERTSRYEKLSTDESIVGLALSLATHTYPQESVGVLYEDGDIARAVYRIRDQLISDDEQTRVYARAATRIRLIKCPDLSYLEAT